MQAGFATLPNRVANANMVRNITEKGCKCKQSSQHHHNNVSNANQVRNIYKRILLFPSRAKPGLTRSLGNQKRQNSKTNQKKNEKLMKQMHLGKHSNFNDFSDGQKTGEIRKNLAPE